MKFYYYETESGLLAAPEPDLPFPPAVQAPDGPGRVFVLVPGDPVLGRGSFRVNHPGQLLAPHGLEVLDASRLPAPELDPVLARAVGEGRVTALNAGRRDWRRLLAPPRREGKFRVNLLALGDVGSTLATGLKLLGGDVISSLGICDVAPAVSARWETELEQISFPWDYDALPRVEAISPDRLFDCDVFVFVASGGIPPVGSQVEDVRMAQFRRNAEIVGQYARQARRAGFRGLWAAVSDPVDPLAKTAYLESNRDEAGNFDGKGLLPEQVQGFGLGVMNARAAYYAKRDDRFASFLTEGRAFGPHGKGLCIANRVEGYDDALSRALTELAETANLRVRELGFKPYIAPAFSSGALSLLLTLRGQWHYGSVFLDGVYLGVKNRLTDWGVETELLPRIPDPLFGRIRAAAEHLKSIC